MPRRLIVALIGGGNPGELGTLVELAYAALPNRPVIFCNSRQPLLQFRQEHQNRLLQKLQIAIAQFPLFEADQNALTAALDQLLAQNGVDVERPEHALAAVLAAALELRRQIQPIGATHFLGLPGNQQASQDFEDHVLTLSE